MRKIEPTTKFRRDYKRELKGRYGKTLSHDVAIAIDLLRTDTALPVRYFDHALTGNWADHRDCHIKPDLILIYRKIDTDVLQLVRLGTHSELGL